MIKALRTIRKRLLPDRRLLDTGQQIGTSAITEIRLHSALHRLLQERLRCNTLRKPLE